MGWHSDLCHTQFKGIDIENLLFHTPIEIDLESINGILTDKYVMILLSCAQDVRIEYIDLCDGEKLYKELLNKEENTKPSSLPKLNLPLYVSLVTRRFANKLTNSLKSPGPVLMIWTSYAYKGMDT